MTGTDARTPPSAPEIEQGLLSCLMQSPHAVGAMCAAAHLTPGHFHEPSHGIVFDYVTALVDNRDEFDLHSATQGLRDAGQLENLRGIINGEPYSGAAFLTCLHIFAPSLSQTSYYIGIIREKHILRMAIKAAVKTINDCHESPIEVSDIVADSQRTAATLNGLLRHQRHTAKTNAQVIDEIIADYRSGNTIKLFGRSIGILEIDDAIGGLMPTDLLLIAGGPSSGKSALALQIEDFWARTYGERVLDFTYEMTQRQKLHRLMQLRSQVNLHKAMHRTPQLGDDTDARIDRGAAEAKSVQIEFIDRETCPPELLAIKAEARSRHAQRPIGLVVLDYDELIRGIREKGQTKEEELSSIAYGWKGLAGELQCPAILLSQITESDKTIKMRGSSAKAQAGNSALYIGETDSQDRRTITILKARDGGGRGQVITLGFRGPTTTFYELDGTEKIEPPNTAKKPPRR